MDNFLGHMFGEDFLCSLCANQIKQLCFELFKLVWVFDFVQHLAYFIKFLAQLVFWFDGINS